ncbi:MAG TPA: methyltransferase domain-containing protein [Acidimicrobiia bacterium]|jgi:demethylmenaquinone methyltransferase/2-methoxy-6-polyprenyl-1,4-benzoquinol methylase
MGAAEGRRGAERPDRNTALDLYAGHADAYDEDTDWAGPERTRAVELLDLHPGETVYDVGCGTGLCFAHLRAAVGDDGRVVGIEQSVDMLGQAQARVDEAGWDNVDLVLGSVEEVDLPLAADAALFCFTHDVLRVPAAVENVLAHLRPGGRVAAVGPMWAPWWAPAMNVLIWYCTSPYVTTYEGFEEPWSHLAARVPDLSVERQELLGRYFAWGRLSPNAP